MLYLFTALRMQNQKLGNYRRFYISGVSYIEYKQSTDIIRHFLCRRVTKFAEPTLHAKPNQPLPTYTMVSNLLLWHTILLHLDHIPHPNMKQPTLYRAIFSIILAALTTLVWQKLLPAFPNFRLYIEYFIYIIITF